MRFHMLSSDRCTSMDMIWVMIATSIFTNSIELKYFYSGPGKSFIRTHQKIPVPLADGVFRAPLFRLSDYMLFIWTSVQAIEPWLCFIVIFPGGYLSNLFFRLFFAKVFFFVITSIFNFPNWNLRILRRNFGFSSYRKNLHVSNNFVPMLPFHILAIFQMRWLSTRSYP